MRKKIFVILFFIIIYSFMFLNIFSKKETISKYERRKLAKFPNITINGLLNKSVTSDIDKYITDNFIIRDSFRTLKIKTEFLLNKTDVNDLFYYKNHYFKYENNYDEKQINKFVQKINYIYENYFNGFKVYYSVIPEKNYYINTNKYKKFDYDGLFNELKNINNNIKYIDITNDIKLEDYYYTDHHLRQDKIIDAVKTLSINMNFEFENNFEVEEYEPFYGTYFGQLLIKNNGEKLYLLHNDTIDSATVYNLEDSYNKVYNYEKLNGVDGYDVFLSGATPYIELVNNNTNSSKELIIFRDSYTSSFAPLMLEGYKKIILLDLRYASLTNLLDKVNIKNDDTDILFLYSTSLINGSDVLKVK